jgi:hypothetical protein
MKESAQTVKYFNLWKDKLTQSGVDVSGLVEKYGTLIMNAPMSDGYSGKNGLEYAGALVKMNLFKIAPYAVNINNMLPESVRVAQESLVRIALLTKISFALFYTPTNDDWKIKRGILWEKCPNPYSLRIGGRTLMMVQESGISVNEEEREALTAWDDHDPQYVETHSGMLFRIIKSASLIMWREQEIVYKAKLLEAASAPGAFPTPPTEG